MMTLEEIEKLGIELHNMPLQQEMSFLSSIHEKGLAGSFKAGADILGRKLNDSTKWQSEEKARQFIAKYWQKLLDEDRYYEATALSWEFDVFDPRPFHVHRVFECLRDHDLVILMGASGCSKTFSVAVWSVLDFLRDPPDSTVRFGSVDERNLSGNLWANLKYLTESCMFKPDGVTCTDSNMSISTPNMRPECGVEAVLLPKSNASTGKVKGAHPRNFRPYSHPIWGRSTRYRIIIDEAQNVFEGTSRDFGSPKMSIDGRTHVMKIICTCNPDVETKWILRFAKPHGGYTKTAMEELYDWTSPEGWRVCRLDARKHENVMFRREIFPHQVTLEKLRGLMKGGVEPTDECYTFGFGWPPPGNVATVVVPTEWFDRAIGTPLFTGAIHGCAGIDVGDTLDRSVLAIGRFGQARGWIDKDGKEHLFDSRKITGETETRHVFVLDQLVALQSKDPAAMADEIKTWCERQQIDPAFVVGDRTGIGSGVMSVLARVWSQNVIGINFRSNSTQRKILAEHKDTADMLASEIASEIYLTVREWINPSVSGFFINPVVQERDRLRTHLTGRHTSKDGQNRFKIEEKGAFIARFSMSPDEGDAAAMATYAVRANGLQLPALKDETPAPAQQPTSAAAQPQSQTTYHPRPNLTNAPWVRPDIRSPDSSSPQTSVPIGFFSR